MTNDNGSQNFAARINTDDFRNDAQQIRNEFRKIGQSAENEGNVMDKAFRKIGQRIAEVFAVSKAKDFVVQVAKVRGEFQQLEIAFETMLGSASQAEKLMSQLVKTAATTPFGMSDIANSAKQLLAYGVAAEDVNETLIRLGDIAAGLSIPINDLAYLYGTTMTQGRVFTQDLRQFMGRGIPLAEELAKQFGVTKDKVGELVTAGKVGFPEVKKAIWDLTDAGSKFGGLMEAQSKTITGQISNIEDSVEQMFNNLGKQSEGIISGALSVVSDLVENYEQVGRVLAGLIETYGVYKAAVMAATAVQSIATEVAAGYTLAETFQFKALLAAEKAQALLNKTMLANPYVLAATACAALVAVLISQRTEQERVNDAYKDYMSKQDEVIKKEQEHREKIEKLIQIAGDESLSTESRRLALVKLEQKYPSVFEKYDTEAEKLQHILDIKREIAAIDGQNSASNSNNELYNVNKRINELTAKGNAKYQTMTTQYGGTQYYQVGGRTQKEEDELKALQRRREELSTKIRKDKGDAYFANLTGVTNADLEKQIRERQNLLAKMETTGHKKGYVSQGGATGTFTKEELEGQVQLLQSEQNRRAQAIADGNKDFLKEADKAYKEQKERLSKLRSLSDPSKRKNSDMEVGGKLVKDMSETEYFDALKAQEEAVKKAKEKAGAKSGGSGKAIENEKKRLADEAAERKQAIEQYGKDVSEAVRDAELDIRQAQINNLKEGYEKQSQQIQLNYDKLIAENKKREKEMIDALADEKMLEWKNANPKATKAEEIQQKASLNLSASDLSQEQQDILKAYTDEANKYRINANRLALEDMLKDVQTYEQRRAEIEKEFAQKRDALYQKNEDGTFKLDAGGNKQLKEGVTQGNLDELNRQMNEALSAVDEQFAAREDSYQAWCEEIGNLSLKQLEDVLAKAKEELDKLEKTGTADSKKLAEARSKVTKATKALNKEKEKQNLNPQKRTIKEWEDLYKTLNECTKSFEDIGDSIGGAVGEAIKSAGQISTATLSMINGIVTLVNMSATGIVGTAAAGTAAIATMEKASVILAIISAALQIAMAIVNLFNNDGAKQKEIENLQNRIDQLQWELDNADTVRLIEKEGSAVERVRRIYYSMQQQILNEYLTEKQRNNWIIRSFEEMYHEQEIVTRSAQKLADAYANIGYSVDKALGSERYAKTRKDLENISEQQVLIQKQIDAERDKKKTDYDQIDEWEKKIEELGQQAVNIINELMEDILGDSAQDMAQQLGDAFIEAFGAGEDAAEAWGEKVKEIVADVMKRMLVQKFLEEPLGQIFDKYKAKWFPNGIGTNTLDQVIADMGDFANDLNAVGDRFKEMWDALPNSVKNMFTQTAEAEEREASEKGIAQASQETVDELNGRATAIQGHTYSIAENTKILLSVAQQILKSVLNIDENTDGLTGKIDKLNSDVSRLRSSVEDLAVRGVRIKN